MLPFLGEYFSNKGSIFYFLIAQIMRIYFSFKLKEYILAFSITKSKAKKTARKNKG